MGSFCSSPITAVAGQSAESTLKKHSVPYDTANPEALAMAQKAALTIQKWYRAFQAIRYMREGGYVKERQVRCSNLEYIDELRGDDGSTYRGQVLKLLESREEPSGRFERIKEGYGEMIWADDRQYLGNWKQNQMDRFGYLKNADGSYYQGYF